MKKALAVLRKAALDVKDDKVLTFAAALAFYTALSLPPLLVLLAWALGALDSDAEQFLQRQATALAGREAGSLVDSVLGSTDRKVSLGGPSGWLGLGALLLAASGVFTQLQAALNRVWEVEAAPGGGVQAWLRKRLTSFGLVGVLAFLMAVSLIASTALSGLGIDDGSGWLARTMDTVASLVVFTLLFTMVFKFLPDVVIRWRDVLGGAMVTAILFSGGRAIVGAYLARKGLSTDYGAAGSAVVVLAWVYFSGIILLVGAEITQAWLALSGRAIEPNEYARRIEPIRAPETTG